MQSSLFMSKFREMKRFVIWTYHCMISSVECVSQYSKNLGMSKTFLYYFGCNEPIFYLRRVRSVSVQLLSAALAALIPVVNFCLS